MNKLISIHAPNIATTVTINGQVICSSADWDRMVNFTLKEIQELRCENERLKDLLHQYRLKFDPLMISGIEKRDKDTDNG